MQGASWFTQAATRSSMSRCASCPAACASGRLVMTNNMSLMIGMGSFGETQSELQQFVPHIALAQALDGLVQPRGLLQGSFDMRELQAARRMLDQGLPILAHPQVAQGIAEVAAALHR